MPEIDHECTQNIVCPHCGREDQNPEEFRSDEGSTECDQCGATFEYTRNIEVTYSTHKPHCKDGRHTKPKLQVGVNILKHDVRTRAEVPKSEWIYSRHYKCTTCENDICELLSKEQYEEECIEIERAKNDYEQTTGKPQN